MFLSVPRVFSSLGSSTQVSKKKAKEHTTPRIRWSSPTQLLVQLSAVYLGESGRDPEFSTAYGRMYRFGAVPVVKRDSERVGVGD